VNVEDILDRYEAPLRRGALAPPALHARGTNPRCGDVVIMYARVEHGKVARASFEGHGCTISQAAADIAAELAEGRIVADVAALTVDHVLHQLGATARVDCASLGLHTLQSALRNDSVRAHVRILGHVQGVGFRYCSAEEARVRRLAGWVRNLESGTVEAVFEGPRPAVEDIVRWCQRGPAGAWVREVKVDWDEPLEHLGSFEIRHTSY
jgi:acylphosphatase